METLHWLLWPCHPNAEVHELSPIIFPCTLALWHSENPIWPNLRKSDALDSQLMIYGQPTDLGARQNLHGNITDNSSVMKQTEPGFW